MPILIKVSTRMRGICSEDMKVTSLLLKGEMCEPVANLNNVKEVWSDPRCNDCPYSCMLVTIIASKNN